MKVQLMLDDDNLGFVTTDGDSYPKKGEYVNHPLGIFKVSLVEWYIPEEDDVNMHPTLQLEWV